MEPTWLVTALTLSRFARHPSPGGRGRVAIRLWQIFFKVFLSVKKLGSRFPEAWIPVPRFTG